MTVVTITGPTGAGKSTIERELHRLGFGAAISHTTRLPRIGEHNGEHYHFVTDFEFDRLNSEGQFIETNELGTRRYAKSKSALRAALEPAKHVAIVVDPNGAAQIHAFCRDSGIPVFGVWVDCDPTEQARRWVMRFASDMIVGKEAVGSYAERLSLMLTEEVRWRAAAASGRIGAQNLSPYSYSLMLRNSNSEDPRQLALQVLRHLD